LVTTEFPLTVEVNSRQVANLACTPRDLKDLVVGLLYTSGFINGLEDLLSLRIARNRRKASAEIRPPLAPLESSPKKIRRGSGFRVEPQTIFRLIKRFQKTSAEFLKTGGIHSAALCSRDKILIFREDLGRHNALDKVIGAALVEKREAADGFILVSGRVPADVLLKIARARVSLLASLSAPTDRAVQMARREGITLIGFARENRFNIYSAVDRVK